MKRTTKLLSLLLVMVLVSGCKQENWLDWKMQNELWLMDNAQKEGVITTPSGLQYKCIKKGPENNPTRPDAAKIVTIDYEGKMINGYVFDANEGYQSYVSSFVSGFAEGLKQMHQFDVYEFYIPYYLGYGTQAVGTEGTSSFIPPYTTLIFRVYLHSVNL